MLFISSPLPAAANAIVRFSSQEDVSGGNNIVFCVCTKVTQRKRMCLSDNTNRSSFIVTRLSLTALPLFAFIDIDSVI